MIESVATTASRRASAASAPVPNAPTRPLHGSAADVELIDSPVQLARLAAEWRALSHALGPTEQFAWSHACAQTLAPPGTLRVHVVRRHGRLVAVAPMARRRAFGVMHAVQLGVDDLFEPTDLPCVDASAADALVAALLAERRPLLLQRLPSTSFLLDALTRLPSRQALLQVRTAPPVSYVALDPDDPQPRLSSRRRSDLRRAQRHAERHGAVETQLLSPAVDEVDGLLDRAFAIEARSWKGERGTALLQDARRHAFFRCWAREAAVDGNLRIAFLHIAGAPAAMQIAAVGGGAYWLLKIGYDRRFADCSPGLLLMRDTLRAAACAGLSRYEVLGMPEAWIQPWTRTQRECVSVRLFPRGARASVAFAGSTMASIVRRMRRA